MVFNFKQYGRMSVAERGLLINNKIIIFRVGIGNIYGLCNLRNICINDIYNWNLYCI